MKIAGIDEVEGIEHLQRLPIFSQLSFDETSRLGAIAVHEEFPEGQVIIEQNAMGEALYVICRGEVRVSRDGDTELGRLSVGEIFGEMSLVDDLLTSARVTVSRDCRVLKLPREEFQKLLDSDDKLALKIYRSFCRTLSERLRKVNTPLSLGV